MNELIKENAQKSLWNKERQQHGKMCVNLSV